ncbi:hypothetical protein MTO96_052306 [Rhipicephalus appendiculatus]
MPVEMRANFVVDDDDTTAGQLSECASPFASSPVELLKYSCLWDYKLSGRSFSWHAGDTCHEAGRKSFPFLTMLDPVTIFGTGGQDRITGKEFDELFLSIHTMCALK